MHFFLLVVAYFVGVNLLFAIGFGLIGLEQIGGMQHNTLWGGLAQAFFFSVQTFTSVGYGAMHPTGDSGQRLGLVRCPGGTDELCPGHGLFFARFSPPGGKIAFSSIGLITPFQEDEAS